MDENMECPICKKKVVFVGVHDDEGNYHGPVGCEYENDPWSGLSYALHHEGWGDCPLCTDGAYSTMGGMLFDTAEEAINALTPPNEPLTLEQLRETDGQPVWVTPLGFWALVIAKPGERVRLISNDGETVWADKEIELVGPVYRRPPEGET
ncbi:hypothetical protein [uncultured Oscillibacter sp.]|uniref:hypothetical protein n=1 Tax=uncultured Oscillibacter sp. TaxID=876091 RepID=UPI002610AED9|nr:hypothetical protein [uncultured Oscillibacter sp.]